MAAGLRDHRARGKHARPLDRAAFDDTGEVRVRAPGVADRREAAHQVALGGLSGDRPDGPRVQVRRAPRRLERQVRVQVDEAGREDAIVAFDDDRACGGVDGARRDLADLLPFDEHVGFQQGGVDAVEDADVLEQNGCFGGIGGKGRKGHRGEGDRQAASWLHRGLRLVEVRGRTS